MNAAADSDNIDRTTIVVHGAGAGDVGIRSDNWRNQIKPIVSDTNSFGNIRNLIKSIGFNATNANGYQDKFGVQLNKRVPIKIATINGQNLESSSLSTHSEVLEQSDILTDWMSQLSDDVNAKEVDMLVLDHSLDYQNNNAPIIQQIAARTDLKSISPINVGVCYLSDSNESKDKDQPIVVDIMHLRSYGSFGLEYKNIYDENGILSWFDNAQAKVIQSPMHGTLNGSDFYYRPNPRFLGNDKIVYLVSGQGPDGKTHSVKLTYFVKVIKDFTRKAYQSDLTPEVQQKMRLAFCGGRPEAWLISSGLSDQGAFPAVIQSTPVQEITAWQRASKLSALLANASQSLISFGDLLGTAVGETTGQGLSAQITLDTNAAGHGWYIDPTPLDNTDDYLPTSDPTVFKAKAGSATEGKMDMLSVLLHEYGHALGLEHSANASDFMAASLQPGVRKLPSAEELALMARLVAELKDDEGGDTLTPALSQGERGQDNPSSPLSALGLLPMGFMRRKDGKGTSTPTTHTDYLTAINPTLTNSNFTLGQNGSVAQWETTGKVDATPSTITPGRIHHSPGSPGPSLHHHPPRPLPDLHRQRAGPANQQHPAKRHPHCRPARRF